ncbi:unnamed protein product [Closterium sp. Yama58-4]|nr:unnamed protein product [Closterium sp. Yama58-4]
MGRPDELKYHGGSSSSRGSFPRINLFLGSDPLDSRLCQPSPLPGFSCSLALQGDRVTLHWALLPTSLSLALQVTDCNGWLSLGFTPSPSSSLSSSSSSSPSKLSALGSYVLLADVSQASAGVTRVSPYSRAAAATAAAATAAAATAAGNGAVGGASVVRSFVLVNHTAQGVQSSNGLEFSNASVTLVNGSALLSFSRPYTQRNGAPNISLGADELSHLVWAFAPSAFPSSGGSASLPNHYLQHRGSLWLNWASGEAQVQASPFPWLIAHASIMAFVFCFLLPLSAVAARIRACTATPEIHTRLPRASGAEVAGRSGRHGGSPAFSSASVFLASLPSLLAPPSLPALRVFPVLPGRPIRRRTLLDLAPRSLASMASATPSDDPAQSPPPPTAEFTANPATSVAGAGAIGQPDASPQTPSQSPSADPARQSQGPVEAPAQDPGAGGKGEGGEIPAGDPSADEIPADGGVPSAAAPAPAAPATPAAAAVGAEQSSGGSGVTPAAVVATAGTSSALNAAAPAFVPRFACAGAGAGAGSGADVGWLPAHLLPPQPLLPLPFNSAGAAQQGTAAAPFAGYGGALHAHALAQGLGGGWGDAGWEAGGVWGAQDALGAMWGSGADGGRREGRADGLAGGGGAGGTARVSILRASLVRAVLCVCAMRVCHVLRVEFYFSDHNMPYDHHLLSMANQDPQGFVSLWYLVQFREVRSMLHASMSTAPGHIVALLADAIREASTTLVLSDDGMRVRRQHPLPFTDVDELQARTVVAHNLPPNLSLSAIEDIFKKAGRVRMLIKSG